MYLFNKKVLFFNVYFLSLFGCTAKTEINWIWTNAGPANIEAYGEYWNDRFNSTQSIGAGNLPANVIGSVQSRGYKEVPDVLHIRWRPDDYDLAAAMPADRPFESMKLPVRSVVGEKFVGNLWIRFDGKSWTLTPQTDAEYQEHRMYSLYPNAPWQPRIVVRPYQQYKLAETDKSIRLLTTFSEADVKRAAELRAADAEKVGR